LFITKLMHWIQKRAKLSSWDCEQNVLNVYNNVSLEKIIKIKIILFRLLFVCSPNVHLTSFLSLFFYKKNSFAFTIKLYENNILFLKKILFFYVPWKMVGTHTSIVYLCSNCCRVVCESSKAIYHLTWKKFLL
jgi:hypothetical protein